MYPAVVLVQELVQQLCSKLYQETNLVQNWLSTYPVFVTVSIPQFNSLFAATEMFMLA